MAITRVSDPELLVLNSCLCLPLRGNPDFDLQVLLDLCHQEEYSELIIGPLYSKSQAFTFKRPERLNDPRSRQVQLAVKLAHALHLLRRNGNPLRNPLYSLLCSLCQELDDAALRVLVVFFARKCGIRGLHNYQYPEIRCYNHLFHNETV